MCVPERDGLSTGLEGYQARNRKAHSRPNPAGGKRFNLSAVDETRAAIPGETRVQPSMSSGSSPFFLCGVGSKCTGQE